MEVEQALEGLNKSYAALLKGRDKLKELNAEVKEAVLAHPEFDEADRLLHEAKAKMKSIKLAAVESTNNFTDIQDAKADIKMEQEVIGGFMAFLLKAGEVEHDQEMTLGPYKVTPKISVRFTKQMLLF